MEDQHSWHMQVIKMQIWLADNFIGQLLTFFKLDYFVAQNFPCINKKAGRAVRGPLNYDYSMIAQC